MVMRWGRAEARRRVRSPHSYCWIDAVERGEACGGQCVGRGRELALFRGETWVCVTFYGTRQWCRELSGAMHIGSRAKMTSVVDKGYGKYCRDHQI